MKKLKLFIKLMRPKHYVKNILILAPLIFSKNFELQKWVDVIIGIFLFSLCSSVVYIVNDIIDVDNDRKHYKKCNRPIASGEVSIAEAGVLAAVLTLISVLLLLLFFNDNFLVSILLCMYILLNLYYSKKGKNVPILDVFILMAFYIVRLYYGSIVAKIHISAWLYLTVLFGALFLGMGKRRNELQKSVSTRDVLKKYSYDFLDKNMYATMTLAIVFYCLWCENNSNPNMLISVPIITSIFMRYSYIIEDKEQSDGDPINVVLQDKCFLFLSLIYCITVILGLYF